MAIYNEILVGRFARMLQKLFSMKGGVPAKQLAGELMAVLPLFNGVENRYLEGWNRFAAGITVTAGGAGNRSAFRIRNPTSSGVVAVIEKLLVANFTGADQPLLTVANGTTDLGSLVTVTNSRLDNRSAPPTPACIVSQSNNAGAVTGSTVEQTAVNTNVAYDFVLFEEQEIPILSNTIQSPVAGDFYTVFSNTLNTGLIGTIVWRERAIEESEIR